jgi:hypothetical protein
VLEIEGVARAHDPRRPSLGLGSHTPTASNRYA